MSSRITTTLLLACVMATSCVRTDPEAELAAAVRSFAAEDVRTATIHLQNALQANPDHAGARVLAGRVALYIGDFPQARDHLELARDRGLPASEYALPLAEAYLRTGAAADATRLLESIPADARGRDYWMLRAASGIADGDFDAAAAALDSAEADGSDADSILQRARLAAARGDRESARELSGRAIALDSENADALAFRAALITEDDPGAAATDLAAAAALYEGRYQLFKAAPVLLALVQTRLALNEVDLAAQSAARLASLLPGSGFADYARALVSYQRGALDEALRLLRQADNRVPNQPQILVLLGAVNLALGNLGQAEQQFLSVLNGNPSDPAAVRLLAETRIRQERPQAALDALRLFDARRDSEDFRLLVLRGAAYLQDGQPAQAIPYLEQALSMNPTHQGVLMQLLQAYSATGRVADMEAMAASSSLLGGDVAIAANVSVVLARMREGNGAAAAAYVERLLEEKGNEPATHVVAAVFHQLSGRIDEAKASLEAALALDPRLIPAHLLLASIYEGEGSTQQAEQSLLAVIGVDPRHLAARMGLAQLAMANGDAADAEMHLRIAAEGSDSIAPDIALARLHIAQGDVRGAEPILAAAARGAPNDPEVLVTQGMLAQARGSYDEAISLLRRVESQLPDRPNVALLLARAQLASGAGEAARETLTRAVERMPSVGSLRAALGAAELRLGNLTEALLIAKDLQAELGTQPVGYALEGQVRMAERRYADAEEMYMLAYQRGGTWELLVAAATAVQLGGDAERAAELVSGWIDSNPAHVPARLYRANLLMNQSKAEEALAEYERVIELDDTNVVALNNAAWLAHQAGRAEALEYARKAVAAAPDSPAVLDTLGWILTRLDRAGEALEYLTRATQLSPEELEIRYHLAVAQARLGRTDAARETLRSLLGDDRQFDGRRAAEELLGTLQTAHGEFEL